MSELPNAGARRGRAGSGGAGFARRSFDTREGLEMHRRTHEESLARHGGGGGSDWGGAGGQTSEGSDGEEGVPPPPRMRGHYSDESFLFLEQQ